MKGRAADAGDPEVGLCVGCRHVRRIVSAKGNAFYRCGGAKHDPTLRPYPQLPVTQCHAFAPVDEQPTTGCERMKR